MNEDFGLRNTSIRIAWGRKSKKGEAASLAEWSRQLGIDPRTRRVYNLEDGRRPHGDIDGLAAIYEPLRAMGADPYALARWAWTGHGEMPSPAGGSIVPNVSAPSAPTQQPAHAGIDPLSLSERALAAADSGEDPRPLLRFMVQTLREARRLGLAAFGGVVLTVLLGGRAEAGEQAQYQDKKTHPTRLRVLRGGRSKDSRRVSAKKRAASA